MAQKQDDETLLQIDLDPKDYPGFKVEPPDVLDPLHVNDLRAVAAAQPSNSVRSKSRRTKAISKSSSKKVSCQACKVSVL